MEELPMDDAFLCLLSDLDSLSKEVTELHNLAENQSSESWGSFISRNDKRDVAVELVLPLIKRNHVDALLKTLENVCQIAEPSYVTEFDFELRQKLNEIMNQDDNLKLAIDSELNSTQQIILKLEKMSTHLKSMRTQRLDKQGLLSSPDWEAVEQTLRSKRRSIIKSLRAVENELYKTSNVSTILNNTLKASRSGEQYVQIEDEWIHDVELLLRSNLLARHPHDEKRIRLVDVL